MTTTNSPKPDNPREVPTEREAVEAAIKALETLKAIRDAKVTTKNIPSTYDLLSKWVEHLRDWAGDLDWETSRTAAQTVPASKPRVVCNVCGGVGATRDEDNGSLVRCGFCDGTGNDLTGVANTLPLSQDALNILIFFDDDKWHDARFSFRNPRTLGELFPTFIEKEYRNARPYYHITPAGRAALEAQKGK